MTPLLHHEHDPSALLLVAHGSRDPAAQREVRMAAARVCTLLPSTRVEAAFLDFAEPRPADAVLRLAAEGTTRVVVVPFLLTAAYHVRVDLPRELRQASSRRDDLRIRQAPALGPDPLLLAAADRRVRQAGVRPEGRDVGVVFAAAGSSDPAAVASVHRVASEYRATRSRSRVVAAYVSQAAPTPGHALRTLRANGFGNVVVLSYLLAPGRFQDSLGALATEPGARVTAPLADTPEVAMLVVARFRQVASERRSGTDRVAPTVT